MLYFVVNVILDSFFVIFIFNCVWIVILIGEIVLISILILVVKVIILNVVVKVFLIVFENDFCWMISLSIVIKFNKMGGFFKMCLLMKFIFLFFFIS